MLKFMLCSGNKGDRQKTIYFTKSITCQSVPKSTNDHGPYSVYIYLS